MGDGFLGLLDLGDVELDSLGADDLSVRTHHRQFQDVQELLPAVGMRILFNQLNGFAGLHDLFMMFHAGGGILGGQPHFALFRRFDGGNFPGCFAQKVLRLHAFEPAEVGG